MHSSELVGTDEWHTVEGRPYVVYKYAATLDGRIAAADTTSQWITSPESRAEVHALLRDLHARGVRGMFLEGGPTLAASFVSAGLVDRIVAYIAPALLGNGKSALQGGSIGTMADILRCDLVDVARSGPTSGSSPGRAPADRGTGGAGRDSRLSVPPPRSAAASRVPGTQVHVGDAGHPRSRGGARSRT
ncbi:hypothetical protein CRI70_14395 [Streptomyces sp. Ru87]|nr:hypothetical protein CRI70_14395 [Streptomyces sp. Ru87]